MINDKEATRKLIEAIFKSPEERMELNRKLAKEKIARTICSRNGFSMKEVLDIVDKSLTFQEDLMMEKVYTDLYSFSIYANEDKKRVVLKFDDGSVAKAKCADEDTFSVEVGMAVAFMKHFLGKSRDEITEFVQERTINSSKKVDMPKNKNNNEPKEKTTEPKEEKISPNQKPVRTTRKSQKNQGE